MLLPLPSAFDDALDTLHEPNAVFGQFLGYASMTFFSLFLSLLPFVALSFLDSLVFSFYFLSFFDFLSFPRLYSISFYVFFPIDLRPSCVCVVIGTTCNIHVVVFLRWQAV